MVIDYVFGVVGVYQTITNTTALSKIGWGIVLICAFVIPPLIAFHRMRKQRDEIANTLRASEQSKPQSSASIVISGSVYGAVINAQVGEVKALMHVKHFDDMKLFIGELFRDSHVINSAVFSNCEIIGPGMIGFDSATRLDNCEFYYGESLESMLVLITGGTRMVTGAVGFTNCVFDHCKFSRVGFLVNEATANEFRKGIGKKK